MQSLLKAIAFREFDPEPSQPHLFSPLFFKTKKGESGFFGCAVFMAFFLL
jgi:hypothetical protein